MLSKIAGIFLLLSFVLAKGVDLIADSGLPAYAYHLDQSSDEVPDEDSKENKLTEYPDELYAEVAAAVPFVVLFSTFDGRGNPNTLTVHLSTSCPPPDGAAV